MPQRLQTEQLDILWTIFHCRPNPPQMVNSKCSIASHGLSTLTTENALDHVASFEMYTLSPFYYQRALAQLIVCGQLSDAVSGLVLDMKVINRSFHFPPHCPQLHPLLLGLSYSIFYFYFFKVAPLRN